MVDKTLNKHLRKGRHGFHIVSVRPWPIFTALRSYCLVLGLVLWFAGFGFNHVVFGVLAIRLNCGLWWRDVIRESTFGGNHTSVVVRSHAIGITLFIVSERLLFFSFFWAFFHSRLAPTPEIGCSWPPAGIQPINPWKIPLFNTIVLISSGVTVTWAHRALCAGKLNEALFGLSCTVLLGRYFTYLQLCEYLIARYSIADRIFGSIFFIATGFHGLHVLVGTLFLIVCLGRIYCLQFSTNHHFGFEAAIWYWHFVDLVWILLFLCIYVWGR